MIASLLLIGGAAASTFRSRSDDDHGGSSSAPPVPPSPWIKKVHIVSLTHLDVGGYGPAGTCEDDCKWAADVCNTYFDKYLPAACATAEELKAAQKLPPPPSPACPPGRGHGKEPHGWYNCPGYRHGFQPEDCEAVGCCVNRERFANVSRYPNSSKSWAGWCFPDHSSNGSHSHPNASFIYFSHPWLVQEYFSGSAGCGRELSTRNATTMAKVEAAVRAGEIAWQAKPFTMVHELCDPGIFSWSLNISHKLNARFGVQHGRSAAKATDVPGVSIGIVPLLARAGVKALHLGTNGMGNTVFPVNITGHPSGRGCSRSCNDPYAQVFRWRHPATGDEIISESTMHHLRTQHHFAFHPSPSSCLHLARA